MGAEGVPVEQSYQPLAGGGTTAADADGLATVSTEAANTMGNTTRKNFDLVDTGHSPTLDNQKSAIAQLVTPKDHPER
jgi:hypothetical protein